MKTNRQTYSREWQQKFRRTAEGKRHVRDMNLKKYGLTSREYDFLSFLQGHVCGACRRPEIGRNQFGPIRLAVDHDHQTNRVRGLLCMKCNRALGLLGDDPAVIAQLLVYRKAR